jgi:hypothetical protein
VQENVGNCAATLMAGSRAGADGVTAQIATGVQRLQVLAAESALKWN